MARYFTRSSVEGIDGSSARCAPATLQARRHESAHSTFVSSRSYPFFPMATPIHELEAGLDAVKEQTYAAGLLGQGLLEHQRMLEALLEELNDPSRADESSEVAERVQAELHDLQEQRDRLFQEISSSLAISGPPAGPKRASLSRHIPFSFSPSPSFKSRDELDRLRQSKADAEKLYEAMRARVLELEKKHEVFKQENWDLYVMQQQLEEKLASRSSAQSKADLERQRLHEELDQVREALEAQRTQFEENEEVLRRLRKERETEEASARRERARFRRNISDLHGQIKQLQHRDAPSSAPRMEPTVLEDEDAQPQASTEHNVMEESDDAALHGADEPGVTWPVSTGSSEVDELRAKLSMAIKRMGRDSQVQRKLREQISDLRKALAQAGLEGPDAETDDENDSPAFDEDEDSRAWMDEPPEKPVPRHRFRAAKGSRPRVVSLESTRSLAGPAGEWVDASMGDESVIVKEPVLDPTMASLLGSSPSMPAGAPVEAPSGGLGAELAAEGYSVRPEMMEEVETDAVAAALAQARTERDAERAELQSQHEAAIAELERQHREALDASQAEHAQKLDVQSVQHREALESLQREHQTRLDGLRAEHDQVLAQRSTEHSHILDMLRAEHAKAMAAAQDQHKSDLQSVEESHARALQEASLSEKQAHERLERTHRE